MIGKLPFNTHWLFGSALLLCSALAIPVSAAPPYFNGFETDTAGWNVFGGSFDASRVPSGTNGITAASGSFFATGSSSTNGPAGDWGGYNFGAGNNVPTAFQGYSTSSQIYLNVGGNFANDTRFDYDSAISNSAGGFQRDFIFNAGFYKSTDLTGPGAGQNRFVVSAGNNSQPGSAFAKDPGHNPIAITNSGWYTFVHNFYNNGGVLAVGMSILDSSNNTVGTWTLSNPGDLISGIGGNRYGWFDYNQFGTNLAFDNTQLTLATAAAVPEPASLAVWGAVSALGAAFGWRRRRAG